jgi:NADH dehydrogenase
MPNNQTHVLILGGGFAGVYTAMYLEKALRRQERERIKITLVNRENYIVFQPLLPEVISGTIEILHTISPIRRLTRHAYLHTREIEEIDLENRTVWLAPVGSCSAGSGKIPVPNHR